MGGVDYAASPEDVQAHFNGCGVVNRVTIPTDRGGAGKGFAYVEFGEPSAVANALLLDGTALKGRALKVLPKRTNVPGLRVRGGGVGYHTLSPYMVHLILPVQLSFHVLQKETPRSLS